MVDLSKFIESKSDQINAEDLIGTEKTIKIRDIIIKENSEQPVEVYYEGEKEKCWRPPKVCRRIMGRFWGYESEDYIGRLVKIYRDEDPVHAGQKIGGIRINGLSDITQDIEMYPHGIPVKVREGRHKTKIYYIERLERPEEKQDPKYEKAKELYKSLQQADTADHLYYLLDEWADFYSSLQESHPEIYAKIFELEQQKNKQLIQPEESTEGD